MKLPSALEHLPRQLAGPPRLRPAIFLDYDGTLTPIVERPEDAVLADETRQVLRRLAKRHPVVVVSGRGREDVARLVDLPELVYAGSHGFDIRGPAQGGEGGAEALTYEPAAEVEGVIADAAEALAERLAEIPGAQVEPKRFTVAVHYRRVPPERVAEVEAIVDRELAARPELRKGGGKKVWELRPALDWDKGKAVLWLLRALELDAPDTLPIYVGDDVTDEDAFAALRGDGGADGADGPRGVGILVSEEPRESAARFGLRDPEEVRDLLRRLAEGPEDATTTNRPPPAASGERGTGES